MDYSWENYLVAYGGHDPRLLQNNVSFKDTMDKINQKIIIKGEI